MFQKLTYPLKLSSNCESQRMQYFWKCLLFLQLFERKEKRKFGDLQRQTLPMDFKWRWRYNRLQERLYVWQVKRYSNKFDWFNWVLSCHSLIWNKNKRPVVWSSARLMCPVTRALTFKPILRRKTPEANYFKRLIY